MDPFLGLAVGQSITNPAFQHFTNVKNRKFAREQYKTQRQDALEDFAMVNTYNSPREQMKRFQEAGLNPNLIYGQGNETSSPRSSSFNGGSAEAPQVDALGNFSDFTSMKQKSAQTDLLVKQMDLMEEEKKLKIAQQFATIASSGKTTAETQRILFELGISQDLRDTTIEGKLLDNEKKKADIGNIENQVAMRIAENLRKQDLHPGALKMQLKNLLLKNLEIAKKPWEIAEIKRKISNLEQDYRLKQFDEKLMEKGINPKDPWYLREIKNILSSLFGNESESPVEIPFKSAEKVWNKVNQDKPAMFKVLDWFIRKR